MITERSGAPVDRSSTAEGFNLVLGMPIVGKLSEIAVQAVKARV